MVQFKILRAITLIKDVKIKDFRNTWNVSLYGLCYSNMTPLGTINMLPDWRNEVKMILRSLTNRT